VLEEPGSVFSSGWWAARKENLHARHAGQFMPQGELRRPIESLTQSLESRLGRGTSQVLQRLLGVTSLELVTREEVIGTRVVRRGLFQSLFTY
jgi:hypothetical protein